MTGSEIVQLVKEQMAQLTGLKPDTVTGLRHEQDGWHVSLDMVELKRIPESSDVLDSYEVVADDEATLITYKRIRRYYRSELLEAGAEQR